MTATPGPSRPRWTAPGGGRRWPRVITVTSGKGGVGKSLIVANLGLELSRHGACTALVESNPGLPDLASLLNRGGSGQVPTAAVEREIAPNLRLLAAVSGEGLESVAADFILIDTASGITPAVLDLVAMAERTLLVTTHEPPALAAAYALVRAAHGRGMNQLDVVLNMATSYQAARESHAQLSRLIEQTLGIRPALAAVIPRDDAARAAVMRGEPMIRIFPYARATRALAGLARTLIDTEGGPHEHRRVSLAVRDRW